MYSGTMGGGYGFKDGEIVPHGNPGWLKVAMGACESSADCGTDGLKASAPSILGVTGEKADGRGRDLASLHSLFSPSVTVFGFVKLWLSLMGGLSRPTSTSSESSLLSSSFSFPACFSVLLICTTGGGLGHSFGFKGSPLDTALTCRAVVPVFCDTREMEFLHKLYFMWLKR